MKAFLGIDTSCYTTSAALVDASFAVIADERKLLAVPAGERGLSQANMVYQHTRNLPLLIENLMAGAEGCEIRAVAVTDKPRRRADSYMPAFLAGYGAARTLAAALRIPLYTISHQENHLLAVLRGKGAIGAETFYGLHLSGGTTELLRAQPDKEGLQIERIGGTSDISAGQFVDRVGVALGLPFPAGLHVEAASRRAAGTLPLGRIFCSDGAGSYSGPEAKGERLITAGFDAAEICSWTLRTVWQGLRKMLDCSAAAGMQTLVAAGGVMSNSYLQEALRQYCRHRGIRLILSEPGFSADNASGAAFWAAWKEGGHDE